MLVLVKSPYPHGIFFIGRWQRIEPITTPYGINGMVERWVQRTRAPPEKLEMWDTDAPGW